MTHYEARFKKPLPERFREIEVCLGCGNEQPCASDCPAGSGWRALRVDGKPLTINDGVELFRTEEVKPVAV